MGIIRRLTINNPIFYILLSVLFLSTTGCAPKGRFRDEKTGYMLGRFNRKVLKDTTFYKWYDSGYKAYTPNDSIIKLLDKEKFSKARIMVFAGTWCGDTKDELPKFYKVIDALKHKPKITLVFVKHNPAGDDPYTDLENKYKARKVPTVIIMDKKKNEKGRILEFPRQTWEKELLDIWRRQLEPALKK